MRQARNFTVGPQLFPDTAVAVRSFHSSAMVAFLMLVACDRTSVPTADAARASADATVGVADTSEEAATLPPLDGAGTSADAGTACGVSGGARSTWEMPRRAIFWKVFPAIPDGGVEGGVADEGCALQRNQGIRCQGTARVRGAGADLELVLGDGSRLQWDASGALVAAPRVLDGGTVWIEYDKRVEIWCSFCGTFFNAELALRRERGGQLLWIGREGHRQEDVPAALAEELFGVSFRAPPTCRLEYEAGCNEVSRTLHDHVLTTTPERLVRNGQRERVETPKGTYEILWTHSTETSRSVPRCADGPGPASDTAFAASRL